MYIISLCWYIQTDQKVSVHLTITVQSSVAHRLFDHPVFGRACFHSDSLQLVYFELEQTEDLCRHRFYLITTGGLRPCEMKRHHVT